MNTTANKQISYRKVKFEESSIVARFQYDMAKETEGKELNQEEVKKAVDSIYQNPNFGFYIVGTTDQDVAVSSELITQGHDIYRSTTVWWFQSVFVEKEYRGGGIFKSMFHEVEKINKENKYPLRLYVENENTRAQQVYQRLGMFDTNEIFIEDDFYFNDSIQYQDNKQFSFQFANSEEKEVFKQHLNNKNVTTLMDKQINSLEKSLQSIDFITKEQDFGNIILVKDVSNQNVIGYLSVFYEYSDWRNGNMIYIYDFRVVNEFLSSINQADIVSSFMHYIKKIYKPKIILTNIRWIIDEKCEFKNTLVQVGLQYGHYRVYEKNKF